MALLLKNRKGIALLCIIAGLLLMGFHRSPAPKESIQWMNFDQAVKLSQAHPKKIIIDVYTSWCGWCKRMDATTYTDQDIVSYINKNFYAVRLNAETSDTFHFNNHLFINAEPEKRGSVNELASSLLDGKMEYPTTVYMDEKFNRLSIAPGYLNVKDLKVILTYFAEDKYKTMTYEGYKASLPTAETK